MPEQHLYEYAILRVVPRVEREEFINVGVILYCGRLKFLQAKFDLNPAKLQALAPEADVALITQYLEALVNIVNGNPGSGSIGCLPRAERFRWLTATRSTTIQSSKVHPGLCCAPAEKLEMIFREMVG